ncbi:MAG: low molecular weight phosphatase family protein, partial [Planctomycetaceae bacterium]
MKTVLFLCTGNYYRSRYAEILFNAKAEEMGLEWN